MGIVWEPYHKKVPLLGVPIMEIPLNDFRIPTKHDRSSPALQPPKQLVLYFQWSLYLPYASMQTVCQYEPPTIARCASFTMAAHRYPGCQQGFGSLAFAVDEDLKDHSDIQLLLINQKWDFCGSFGLPALKIRNFLKTKCPIHICLESKSEKI